MLEFQPHKEKRAERKQKGAMGGKIKVTSSVYMVKLLNSCKKDNIINLYDVRSPIIPSGNQYIFVSIPQLSIGLCNLGIGCDVPSRKCPKACVDLYSIYNNNLT